MATLVFAPWPVFEVYSRWNRGIQRLNHMVSSFVKVDLTVNTIKYLACQQQGPPLRLCDFSGKPAYVISQMHSLNYQEDQKNSVWSVNGKTQVCQIMAIILFFQCYYCCFARFSLWKGLGGGGMGGVGLLIQQFYLYTLSQFSYQPCEVSWV